MRLYLPKQIMSILMCGLCAYVHADSRTFEYNGRVYTYDEAMTMKQPPAGVKVVNDDSSCKKEIEGIVKINSMVFDVLGLAEGGFSGMAKSWPTKDGGISWDTGKYSINEINWPLFEGRLSPFDLRWNDCASLVASAYIIDQFYRSAEKQLKSDIIKGVEGTKALENVFHHLAGYNSATPQVRKRYQERIAMMVGVMIISRDGESFWASN
jgi:hypothetical protein